MKEKFEHGKERLMARPFLHSKRCMTRRHCAKRRPRPPIARKRVRYILEFEALEDRVVPSVASVATASVAGALTSDSGIKVLVMGADSSMSTVGDVLKATAPLANAQIDTLDSRYQTPTLSKLENYTSVLSFTNYPPHAGLGDVLKEYVDGGGRLVLATYSFSSTWAISGGIMEKGYSPFAVESPGFNFVDKGDHTLRILASNDPLFNGISGSPKYWTNSNYTNPTLDSAGGATLLASDNFGNAVVAENHNHNVVGISIFPGNLQSDDPGIFRLFANALVPGNIQLTASAGALPAGTGAQALLTATVTTDTPRPGTPLAGAPVSFTVVSGPNAQVILQTTVNTDDLGQATFSYSSAVPRTDQVQAQFVDSAGKTQTATVSINWTVIPPIITTDPATGNEGAAIPLSITVKPGSANVSLSSSVQISGVPSTARLSAGHAQDSSVWDVPVTGLAGLTLTDTREEKFTLTVTASDIETEIKGESSAPLQVNVTEPIHFSVPAQVLEKLNAGPPPSVTIPFINGHAVLDLNAVISEPDVDEQITGVQVDYGFGEPQDLGASTQFHLSNAFTVSSDQDFSVTITTIDSNEDQSSQVLVVHVVSQSEFDAFGSGSTLVVPAGSGGTASAALPANQQSVSATLSGNSGSATLWVVNYNANPNGNSGGNIQIGNSQTAAAYDVRVSGDVGTSATLQVTFTFHADSLDQARHTFLSFTDKNGHVVPLNTPEVTDGTPNAGKVQFDALTHQASITVTFDNSPTSPFTPKISDLTQTVFTVAVPAPPPAVTTAAITPPTSVTGLAGIPTLSVTTTFSSSTQLLLVVRVSQGTDLSASTTTVAVSSPSVAGYVGSDDQAPDEALRQALDIGWFWDVLDNPAAQPNAGPRRGRRQQEQKEQQQPENQQPQQPPGQNQPPGPQEPEEALLFWNDAKKAARRQTVDFLFARLAGQENAAFAVLEGSQWLVDSAPAGGPVLEPRLALVIAMASLGSLRPSWERQVRRAVLKVPA